MRRTLLLTDDPIDEPALVAGRPMSAGMGAAIVFSGVVRGSEDGAPIGAIGYEGFRAMVERQFGLLFDEMERRDNALREHQRKRHKLLSMGACTHTDQAESGKQMRALVEAHKAKMPELSLRVRQVQQSPAQRCNVVWRTLRAAA